MQTSSTPGAASVAGVLQAEYGLQDARIICAPQGADRDSTLFRVEDACGRDWIARLRHGPVKCAALDWLMEQTTSLGRALCDRSLPLVPCHADIHAGNVLVDVRGRLHLLDLDTLLLAPRERDLMFIGAGVAGHWRDAQEAIWFYEGYGPQQPDAQAMAYYRCERIIADVVDYCDQLSGADSAQGRPAVLAELRRQLAPGPELQIARGTVAALPSA